MIKNIKINGESFEIGAADKEHTHTAEDIGAAKTEHLHNEYAPKEHTHTFLAADVGAAAKNHTHTAEDVGAAPAYSYGTDDLTAGTSEIPTGKLYFVYE